ncbi:MAG: DUF3237 family protein [Lachnospiraceae bacterium]|nr:DUF3237 family protein [Lachnospiraceae bacterium]
MEKQAEITVEVIIDGFSRMEGAGVLVQQIPFHGTFTCKAGSGVILPGGVDTQVKKGDGPLELSARYILEGKTEDGEVFHIYVENNGSFLSPEDNKTRPTILTDYEPLKYLETAPLTGTVEPNGENGVLIRIINPEA